MYEPKPKKKITRRGRKEIDGEVLKILINLGENGARWQKLELEAEKEKIAPKVLSASLKRLRSIGLVGMAAVNGETDRPTIQYFHLVDLVKPPFDAFKFWFEELDKIRSKLKKTKSPRLRAEIIDKTIDHALWGYKIALSSALWEVVNSPDDKLGREKFNDILTTLIADPSNFALSLALENKNEVKENLENLAIKIRKMRKKIQAEKKGRRKGKGR